MPHYWQTDVSGSGYFFPLNFANASGVTGVKKFTRLPSGLRNKNDLLTQGIVVGICTMLP